MQRFSNFKYPQKFTAGFSLLEVLIVIAVLVILSSIGIGFYFNYGKNVDINSFSQTMIYDLKQTQARAMKGEGGVNWGIHFINSSSSYKVFYTTSDYGSSTEVSTTSLPGGIVFTYPPTSGAVDIIFKKISGRVDTNNSTINEGETSIPVTIQSSGFSKTVTTTVIGVIY